MRLVARGPHLGRPPKLDDRVTSARPSPARANASLVAAAAARRHLLTVA
jgi:hypothetical protein